MAATRGSEVVWTWEEEVFVDVGVGDAGVEDGVGEVDVIEGGFDKENIDSRTLVSVKYDCLF